MLVSPCGVVWRGPVQGRKGTLLRARARQSRWSSKNVTDHLAPQDPARGREFFHGPGYELCHGVVFRVQRAQVMPLRTVDEEVGDGLKELDCEFPVLDPPAIRGQVEQGDVHVNVANFVPLHRKRPTTNGALPFVLKEVLVREPLVARSHTDDPVALHRNVDLHYAVKGNLGGVHHVRARLDAQGVQGATLLM